MSRSGTAAVPMPIEPGPEMAALSRFHRDVTWTGTIAAGGMGPGTPEMRAEGLGRHQVIQDGRWVVGDYRQEQYTLDGAHVLTWQLHWVAGWDPTNREYRATVADCYGHAEVMRGWIVGDRLVFESIGDPPVLHVETGLTTTATPQEPHGRRQSTRSATPPW